jgi:hypothetical protein
MLLRNQFLWGRSEANVRVGIPVTKSYKIGGEGRDSTLQHVDLRPGMQPQINVIVNNMNTNYNYT